MPGVTAQLKQPGTIFVGPGASYTHTQDVAAAVWTVAHGLGMRPAVTVVDTVERVVEAQIDYVDNDTVTVTFASAQTGKAYLS
jgi:hypothetical protein